MSDRTTDMMIFVTGVVGRAMGSGQFPAEKIPDLTNEALAAFHTLLEPQLRGFPPPGRSQIAPPPPPHTPPAFVVPVSQEGSLESSFPAWEHERIGLGKKDSPLGKPWGEVTWAEAYRGCAAGNAQVVSYLSWISEKYEVKPGKWAEKDQKLKRRATCVLAMARNGSRPPSNEPPDPTPF